MRVLLVDDSSAMRRIQRTQLNNMNITDIIEAGNGKEALDMLASNMPLDLVTLDINMPEMDGMTCLRAIRKDPAYASVKVVMVTSESEKKKVIEAIQAGANNYIVKPFTPEAYREKLGI